MRRYEQVWCKGGNVRLSPYSAKVERIFLSRTEGMGWSSLIAPQSGPHPISSPLIPKGTLVAHPRTTRTHVHCPRTVGHVIVSEQPPFDVHCR